MNCMQSKSWTIKSWNGHLCITLLLLTVRAMPEIVTWGVLVAKVSNLSGSGLS